MKLDKKKYVLPSDSAVGWDGTQDLSVEAYTGWDKKNFYFAAKVFDDIFFNKWVGYPIWKGDSIQMGFDTLNDAKTSAPYDNNDYEYNIALTKEGPQVWRGYAATGKDTGSMVNKVLINIKKHKGYVIYELAIPWKELSPIIHGTGAMFGFNFMANENDGKGRYYWMGLTPGIGEGKMPSMFRKFVLVD